MLKLQHECGLSKSILLILIHTLGSLQRLVLATAKLCFISRWEVSVRIFFSRQKHCDITIGLS